MKFKKDPNAVLDYLVDFKAKTNNTGPEDYLQTSETITTATVVSSAPADLVVDSSTVITNNTGVLIWLSGGTLNTTYSIRVRIVTSLNRTDDRTFQIQVVER
jgi:hypothetical protein